MNIRDFNNTQDRRKALEKETKTNLDNIGSFSFDENLVKNKNIENMIGVTQIPLGIAGLLKINKTDYYIPLATTEGALVASVSRGCKAVNLSGGVSVFVENVGVTRGPVFKTTGLKHGVELKKWLDDNFKLLRVGVKKTSSHLNLLKLEAQVLGTNVFVRLYFDTSDAMGMNMVTIATDSVIGLIEQKTQARCLSVAGNYDIDKKPAWLNFINGRGKKVWAEAVIPHAVIKDVLKTTPEKIHEVVIKKCLLGSIISGSMGFNAHYANIIAAIFASCGQDLAHVVEGSLGITTTELIGDNLYMSCYLPDLMVGTVGGGTGLPAQKEALAILGNPTAMQFAEIVGGAVLAGELSLLGALAAGHLSKAHEKLGRGK